MKKSLVLTTLAASALVLSACASDMGNRHGGGHHARPGGGHHGGHHNAAGQRPHGPSQSRPHARPDRPDRPDRPARPDRPDRHERPNRPDRGQGHNGQQGHGRPDAPAPQCQVADYQQYVGRNRVDIPAAPINVIYRVLGPTTPATRDYRAERVNFHHDANGTITSVTCG